jgi:hypothetical protein
MTEENQTTWYVMPKREAKQGPYTLGELLHIRPLPGMRLRRANESQWRLWEEACRDLPIVAVMGQVKTFDPLLLQEESFLTLVADPKGRQKLIAALAADRACTLSNYLAYLLPRISASADELQALVAPLLAEGDTGEWIVSGLVDHPRMPVEVMFQLAEQGRCIGALGYRQGPRELLEILAAKHQYSKAIETLASEYYAGDEVGAEEFVRFVTAYRSNLTLRRMLRQAELSPEKKLRALEIIGADEEAYNQLPWAKEGLRYAEAPRPAGAEQEIRPDAAMGLFRDGWTQADVEAVMARGIPDELVDVPIVVSMNPPDCAWAESVCVRLAMHPDINVRSNALSGFGHLARTCGTLTEDVVGPLIQAGLQDAEPDLRTQAYESAGEIACYLEWTSVTAQVARCLWNLGRDELHAEAEKKLLGLGPEDHLAAPLLQEALRQLAPEYAWIVADALGSIKEAAAD